MPEGYVHLLYFASVSCSTLVNSTSPLLERKTTHIHEEPENVRFGGLFYRGPSSSSLSLSGDVAWAVCLMAWKKVDSLPNGLEFVGLQRGHPGIAAFDLLRDRLVLLFRDKWQWHIS